MGTRIAVTLDGEPLFEVDDAGIERGGIGLYAWNDSTARFSDIRIEDLRPDAPVPYRFSFTTSRFATFAHHLHSHDDDVFVRRLAAGGREATTIAAAMPAASTPTGLPGDAEARAYDDVAVAIAGQAARQDPARAEVTRIEIDGQARGLLLRTPEPIDWLRTSVELLHSPRGGMPPFGPGAVKLTSARLGASMPNDETVDLMVRDGVEVAGMRIEQRTFPGGLVDAGGAPVAARAFPSQPAADEVLVGDPAMADQRVRALLRADGSGRVGVILRHADPQNHYRIVLRRSSWRRRRSALN
jgi:hypothetical protein